jgi:hypothetical protein
MPCNKILLAWRGALPADRNQPCEPLGSLGNAHASGHATARSWPLGHLGNLFLHCPNCPRFMQAGERWVIWAMFSERLQPRYIRTVRIYSNIDLLNKNLNHYPNYPRLPFLLVLSSTCGGQFDPQTMTQQTTQTAQTFSPTISARGRLFLRLLIGGSFLGNLGQSVGNLTKTHDPQFMRINLKYIATRAYIIVRNSLTSHAPAFNLYSLTTQTETPT